MNVGVEISSLGIKVADCHRRSDTNISIRVYHTTATKGVLKLGAHESISLTRVGENEEVNAEHGHVEDDGNEDEADRASDEMPDKEPGRDTEVTKKIPELLRVPSPTVAMVKRPTHLQLTTAPRERPVIMSHIHQASVKGS